MKHLWGAYAAMGTSWRWRKSTSFVFILLAYVSAISATFEVAQAVVAPGPLLLATRKSLAPQTLVARPVAPLFALIGVLRHTQCVCSCGREVEWNALHGHRAFRGWDRSPSVSALAESVAWGAESGLCRL